MASLQLEFSLRTSSNAKTAHLVGNWDGYKGKLPLSKDSAKSGAWRGTFRFPTSTLEPGRRYWYYYVIDGYHVSHDPAQQYTTEPTTGRKLNILDVPKSSSATSKPQLSVATSTTASSRSSADKRSSRRVSAVNPSQYASGRSISPSKIVHPRPQRPRETAHITQARYSGHSPRDIDDLSRRLASTKVSSSSFSDDDSGDEYSDSEIDSDVSSDLPSLSSGSSRASPSSLASPISRSGSACSCERWGVTKRGEKVKLDCGGSRCGSGSDLSASSDSEGEQYKRRLASRDGAARRHGMVMRDSRGYSRR